MARNKIFVLETVAVTAAKSLGLGLELERKQWWFCHSSSVKARGNKKIKGARTLRTLDASNIFAAFTYERRVGSHLNIYDPLRFCLFD